MSTSAGPERRRVEQPISGLDGDFSTENPVLEGVEPFGGKRTNGHTVEITPSNPLVYEALHTRDSLGSRVSVSETDADSAVSDTSAKWAVTEPPTFADYDVPGADADDSLPPFVVESTPEQVAEALSFFEAAKAAESPEQVKRARSRSRVFSIMQYHRHPDTGVTMLTQEQIDAGLEALRHSIYRYAYVWHLYDRLVSVDEGTGEPFCYGLKGPHWHLVLWMNEDRPTIRTVSDAFTIPSPRVRVPKEVAAQEGAQEHKGRNAAEKAGFDLAEYLPHESRGSHALRGITQPERHYLVDTSQDGNPGKYQYGRGRVVANFDFSRELDAHMAGRVSATEGGGSLRARKLNLRRAVMAGMPLKVAREKDRDAYADDLPRLRDLAREYSALAGQEVAAEIGKKWRKSLVLAIGSTRQGKDALLAELAVQLAWTARLAGLDWSYVEPAGKNTLEGIGRAEIVHHVDMRYALVPGYDEGLRYFDANRASEAGTRHVNTPAPTPRVIMASSSETLTSLGYTLKRRVSSEYLAELASDHKTAPKRPLDIDEFLYRVGWYVEVSKPVSVGDDLEATREGMLASIYRIREGSEEHRVEPVFTRSGDRIGDIRTQHVLEPVAMIRGCENAARFLAVSIIQERSPDVVEAIPAERMAELVSGRLQIETDAQALVAQQEREQAQERLAATNEAARQADERRQAEQRRTLARLEEQARLLDLCTCADKPPIGCLHKHADECPVLSDEVRQERVEARQRDLDDRVARLRANGGVLPVEQSKRRNP